MKTPPVYPAYILCLHLSVLSGFLWDLSKVSSQSVINGQRRETYSSLDRGRVLHAAYGRRQDLSALSELKMDILMHHS